MHSLRAVIERADSDAKFRDQLKANPAAAFKAAGIEVPAGASFEVIDRSLGEIHLLLGARTGVSELDRMLERADRDAAFRESLQRDPRSTVEAYVGQKLPPTCKVHVREADPDTIYIYLGGRQEAGRELSDDDLQSVAGGNPLLLGMLIGFAAGSGTMIGLVAVGQTGTLRGVLRE